jgi:hypothetical protein
MLVIGSLVVGALLSYATTVSKAVPVTRGRAARIELARAGIRMAISLQRDAGPSACFSSSTTFRIGASNVKVTCKALTAVTSTIDRFGVITTGTEPTAGVIGSGGSFVKPLQGEIFINGGKLAESADEFSVAAPVILSAYASTSTLPRRYDKRCHGETRCLAKAAEHEGKEGEDKDADNDEQDDDEDDDDGKDSDGDGQDHDGVDAVVDVTTGDCTDLRTIDAEQFVRRKQTNGSDTPKETPCTVNPWWSYAGDLRNDGSRTYPALPPAPAYERSGALTSVAGCSIYYPGRYLGSTPLTLTGGKHYFASGVYYFERPIVISAGATVVFGEGKERGCSFDADASFAVGAPPSTDIGGKGATLIFGGAGSLKASGGSKVTVNRRLSTAANRASSQLAIRTVSFGIDTPQVEVPADSVRLPDGTATPAATYQVTVGAATARYQASTLATSAAAVAVDVGGGGRAVFEGAVFTPNAKVSATSATSSYTFQMAKGVVASSVELKLPTAPTTASAFSFGVVNEVSQRKFELVASVTTNKKTLTSSAQLDVDINRRYAVNSWTVEQ